MRKLRWVCAGRFVVRRGHGVFGMAELTEKRCKWPTHIFYEALEGTGSKDVL